MWEKIDQTNWANFEDFQKTASRLRSKKLIPFVKVDSRTALMAEKYIDFFSKCKEPYKDILEFNATQ